MVLFLVLWKGQDDLWELGTWFCARGYVIWEWIHPPVFFGKGWRPLGLVLNMYNDLVMYSSLYLWATVVLWTGLGPKCSFSFTAVGASMLFQAASLYPPPPPPQPPRWTRPPVASPNHTSPAHWTLRFLHSTTPDSFTRRPKSLLSTT